MRVKIEEGKTPLEMIPIITNKVKNKNNKEYTEGTYKIMDSDNKRCLKVITITGTLSKVDQSYGQDLSINNLIAKADKKNLLKHQVKFEGEYDDIPFTDYQEAMNEIAKANSMFHALPSNIRSKFENPGKFLEFAQNPENKQKLTEMGILRGIDGKTLKGDDTGYTPNKDNAAQIAADQAASAAKEADKSA